jgi:phenylalanyl-tRNA synthetase alpha chain
MAIGQHGQQDDLPSEILQLLSKHEPILSSEALPSQKAADVKGALDRLASRSMVKYDTIDREEAILEDEGAEIEANGSHEARVFEALRKAVEGLTVKELEAAIGDKKAASVGQGKAFKSKWITKAKDGRLIASVSCFGAKRCSRSLITVDRFNTRHNPRATSNHTKDKDTSRSKGHCGLKKAETRQDAEGD